MSGTLIRYTTCAYEELNLISSSNTSLNYIKNKREKVSKCNICKKEASMTWDHVPPKGGLRFDAVEMRSFFVKHGNTNEDYFKISQNGVKYRTLCKDCNSLLGQKWDKVLNGLALGIGDYIEANTQLPQYICVKTKPSYLVKAIFGHLLAAKATLEETVPDEQMRKFVLSKETGKPEKLKVFYWIYPYGEIDIVRDIVMPSKRGLFREYSMFSLLKYFPIAYLVTDLDNYEGLDELTKLCTDNIDDEAEIIIDLMKTYPPAWPNIVDDKNIIAGGQSIMSSINAKARY